MTDTAFNAVSVEPTANRSIKALKIVDTAVWVAISQQEMAIDMQDMKLPTTISFARPAWEGIM